jgi:hypothetical protein
MGTTDADAPAPPAALGADWTRAMVPDVRALAPNLVVAGVLPVVCYALLRPHVSSDAVALAAVMVFPLAEIAFERRRAGRFEPVGIISLVGITAGLVGALVTHGDAFLLKMRDSVLTGMFGVVCLVTLPAPRPAMWYLGRAFATGGDRARQAEFDELWAVPTVSRRFRVVTAMWGLGLVGEAAMRTVLVLTLSTGVFLVVAQVLGWTVLGALLWATLAYTRRGEQEVVDLLAAVPAEAP